MHVLIQPMPHLNAVGSSPYAIASCCASGLLGSAMVAHQFAVFKSVCAAMYERTVFWNNGLAVQLPLVGRDIFGSSLGR